MSEIKIGAGAWMGHGPCESERAFPTSRRPLLLSAGRSRHRQGISAMGARERLRPDDPNPPLASIGFRRSVV